MLVDSRGVLISTRLSPAVSKQLNAAIIVIGTSSGTLAFKPIALSITWAKLHPILNSRSVSKPTMSSLLQTRIGCQKQSATQVWFPGLPLLSRVRGHPPPTSVSFRKPRLPRKKKKSKRKENASANDRVELKSQTGCCRRSSNFTRQRRRKR